MPWVTIATVESETVEKKSYRIQQSGDAVRCSCMAYVFSKSVPKRCKHLDAFDAARLPAKAASQAVRTETVRVRSGGEQWSVRALAIGVDL